MSRLLLLLVLAVATGACRQHVAEQTQASASAAPAAVKGPFTPAELRAFTALRPINTHIHIFTSDPALIAMLKRLNLHVVDICVYVDYVDSNQPLMNDLPEVIRRAQEFIKASDGHASLCTMFDPYPFEKPGFAQAAIRQINRNFAEGAIAVKIWKNIGMEIKDKNGHYILPDNPAYEPIYRDIAAHNKTLIAHLADPDSFWKPQDPASPGYNTHRKQWYIWQMYGKPGAPSKADILRARDHLLAENPHLRVVGAHFGSLESNFDELGRDFDRFPNFAVDTAARMSYVMMLPRDRAIAFITKYQDRLIYGTDLQFWPGAKARTFQELENSCANDWRFLATNDWVEYQGKKYQGLDLPQPILEKIYHANAVHWFPGILGKQH
jgi:predicted TIM-barrel fold metal-dependent hydrolase